MKSKDVFTIIIVAVVSIVLSVIASNILINNDKNRSQKVEVIEPITAELQRPPTEYYNSSAINPTQTIQIGGGGTNQPFGSQ